MNKLLELLNSLAGKELSAEDIKKAKGLIEKVKVKLDEKDDQIKKLEDEMKPIKAEAEAKQLKEDFVKAGGHESQFEKAQKYGLSAENVKDFVKDFPTLGQESKTPNLTPMTKQVSGGGSQEEEEEANEGSFIVRPGMTFDEPK